MSLEDKRLEKLVKRLRRFSKTDSASRLNEKKAERCLHQLQSLHLTAEQLQRSGLAAIVNRLRKLLRSDAALKVARRLIKDWKLAVAEAHQAAMNETDGQEARTSRQMVTMPAASANKEVATASVHHHGSGDKKAAAVAAMTAENVGAAATNDPVRAKCREMLQQALEQDRAPLDEDSTDEAAAVQSPRCLATEIESSVFADFASADAKYKNRIRSLLMNLRDPKNPALRHCLLRGALGAAAFARMTSQQMASDEMKQLREKLAKEAIRVHQTASAPTEAGSSLFTCKRCRKKNCTYNQLQTLPGDEPMTTYVFCNECGFRWKFN